MVGAGAIASCTGEWAGPALPCPALCFASANLSWLILASFTDQCPEYCLDAPEGAGLPSSQRRLHFVQPDPLHPLPSPQAMTLPGSLDACCCLSAHSSCLVWTTCCLHRMDAVTGQLLDVREELNEAKAQAEIAVEELKGATTTKQIEPLKEIWLQRVAAQNALQERKVVLEDC